MISNRTPFGQYGPWLLAIALLAAACGCSSSPAPESEPTLGDGTTYQLGLLRRGPNWVGERNALEDSLQREHLANMQRMYDEGLMVAAGPFEGGGEYSGLFIFGGSSVEAIERETEKDPRIATDRLLLDLYDWDAPPGIGIPYRIRAEQGLPDSMVSMPFALVRRGPQWNGDTSAMAYATALVPLAEAGQIATSGALSEAGDLMAALMFSADSATVRNWADSNPTVQAGEIENDMLKWWTAYGSMPGDTL